MFDQRNYAKVNLLNKKKFAYQVNKVCFEVTAFRHYSDFLR